MSSSSSNSATSPLSDHIPAMFGEVWGGWRGISLASERTVIMERIYNQRPCSLREMTDLSPPLQSEVCADLCEVVEFFQDNTLQSLSEENISHLHFLLEKLQRAQINVGWLVNHLRSVSERRRCLRLMQSVGYFEARRSEYMEEQRVGAQRLGDMAANQIRLHLVGDASRQAFFQACKEFDEARKRLDDKIIKVVEHLRQLRSDIAGIEVAVNMIGVTGHTSASIGLFDE